MTQIEIEVPVSFVERGIKDMREEYKKIEETIEFMEDNNLQHTESFKRLEAEKEDLDAGIEHLQAEVNAEIREASLEALSD